MSNQPENEMLQPQTVTPKGLREFLLTEIEVSKQVLVELSDEQLEEIAGGIVVEGRLREWVQRRGPVVNSGSISTPSGNIPYEKYADGSSIVGYML